MQVTILTYDVWGNQDDGFNVNNTFKYGTFEFDGTADDLDEHMLDFLNEHFFATAQSATSVEIRGSGPTDWHVDDAETSEPLCGVAIDQDVE